MKAWFGVLVVAAIAVVVFMLFSGESFGASSDAPLGTFDEYDAFLLEKDLRKARPDAGDLKRMLGESFAGRDDLIIWQYWDRVPGYPHFILVAAEKGGKVVAVSAQIRSGSAVYSAVGSRSLKCLAAIWQAFAGDDPNFVQKIDRDMALSDYLEATFAQDGVRGSWRKDTGTDSLLNTSAMVDKLHFRLQ